MFRREQQSAKNMTHEERKAALRQVRRALERETEDANHVLQCELRRQHVEQMIPPALLNNPQKLAAIAQGFLSAIASMKSQKLDATKALRQFLRDNDITRPVMQPDVIKTIAIINACLVAEGGLTAGLLYADGHAGLVSATMNGFVIALANIIIGCASGFYFGRYLNYRAHAPKQSHIDKLIRIGSRIGLGISTGLMLVMHYAAGRSRILGRHDDLFNWADASFFASFNDYFGLGLMGIGIVGSGIAFHKGRSGFKDPIPHYSDLVNATERYSNDAAAAHYDTTLERLDALYEQLSQQLQDALPDEADHDAIDLHDLFSTLRENISAHNDNVTAAIEALESEQQRDLHARQYIEQRHLQGEAVDTTSYGALRLELPPLRTTTR